MMVVKRERDMYVKEAELGSRLSANYMIIALGALSLHEMELRVMKHEIIGHSRPARN